MENLFDLTTKLKNDNFFSQILFNEIKLSSMATFGQLLKEKALLLTRSQRKLLEYILAHEDEAIFLNIEDLARKVNVSEATVVRLSKVLGFKGFPQFQKELRLLFRSKLTTTSRLEHTVQKGTNEGDILFKILQNDMNNIAETMKDTSVHEFREFVKAIDSAQRIVIIGLRSVYSLATFFGVALEFLQKDVWVVEPGIGDLWDRLLRLKREDLVIAISFPRYTRETVEAFKFAKSQGVKTLAITDSLISPLAQYADHVLTARYRMDSFIESFTAALSLINAIVTAVGISNKKKTLKSLKGLEEVWERQEVYFPTTK
jgi:DNA-binding MurR/RpiR family transcriptional regulator